MKHSAHKGLKVKTEIPWAFFVAVNKRRCEAC